VAKTGWSTEVLVPVKRMLRQVTDSVVTQLQVKPKTEIVVKGAGGVVAAVFAYKYAGSLRAACAFGVLSGVFAHSLYADVIANHSRVSNCEQHVMDADEEDDASSSDDQR
jgi:hypothetical protein